MYCVYIHTKYSMCHDIFHHFGPDLKIIQIFNNEIIVVSTLCCNNDELSLKFAKKEHNYLQS